MFTVSFSQQEQTEHDRTSRHLSLNKNNKRNGKNK